MDPDASEADTGVLRELIPDFKVTDKFACIITGIRRCGKSTLLYQLRSRKYKDAFYFNFDDNRIDEQGTRHKINRPPSRQ